MRFKRRVSSAWVNDLGKQDLGAAINSIYQGYLDHDQRHVQICSWGKISHKNKRYGKDLIGIEGMLKILMDKEDTLVIMELDSWTR